MDRTLFDEDHEALRRVLRSFFRKQIAPELSEWEALGHPPRTFWRQAGELGLLGFQVPAKYGGGGQDSFLFNVVVAEEAQYAGVPIGGLRVHADICMPYFRALGNDDQRDRWLPSLVSGEAVSALAISEPDTGSDMKALRTRAVLDGDSYVLNGAKTFISNGLTADLVIVAARTDADRGRDGLSLLVVDAQTEGYVRGRGLKKIGLAAQDIAEISFKDARVPAGNLLGVAGGAFQYLTRNLAQERLSIAVNSQAAAVTALANTLQYVQNRRAFGTTIGSFQNTKFELASCATEVEAGQAMLDKALVAHEGGKLAIEDAAMVKLFCTEMQGRVVDRCVQLYGGYGYLTEYPIAKAYADARVSRIYAGSSEIMKVIISKSMGL
jgi:acyl-CoA dehydrogenase